MPLSDHPRIRGEHAIAKLGEEKRLGSSPHTRGAPPSTGPSPSWKGIIPAYAGSTHPARRPRMGGGDHPRIRGEHFTFPFSVSLGSGSSPHTRGAHVRGGGRSRVQRIIPAYAGSTPGRPSPVRIPRDHPRIRGEHVHPGDEMTVRKGSSPHTRGAPPTDDRNFPNFGIIPAYAGSTCCPGRRGARGTDHPRIRGEHWPTRALASSEIGSSPHTRGAQHLLHQFPDILRIIPAYAGSTLPVELVDSVLEDHPRIRGEHV